MFKVILTLIASLFSLYKPSQITTAVPTNQPSPSPTVQIVEKCPPGFILVPGSNTYHTTDFCVMKYDAKCASKTNLTQGLEPPSSSSCNGKDGHTDIGTYKNNGQNCACIGDKQIVSTSSGFPITFIPEVSQDGNNAKNYCQLQGWHLITNDEWMTIARNVEKVNDNWCNKDGTNCGNPPGTPGKILANGHNDNSGYALVASLDDQPCFGTTTDGSNKCGGKSSQKRTLTLTNNQIIWDLAGNVWTWVDTLIARKDQPQSTTNGILDHGWKWSEFSPGGKTTVITNNGRGPTLGYDAFRPSNPNWNSTNGVGRIYHYSAQNDTNDTLYTAIRGGNWRHGYDSGAFTTHLSPQATKTNIDDVGFRCVSSVL